MLTRYERILGAMIGDAAGDAMGSATETRPTYLIKEDIGDGGYVFDFKKPLPDTLASGMERGAVTDDFSLSYLTIKHILKAGKITRDACVDALGEWVKDYDRYYTRHAGPTTRSAVAKVLGVEYKPFLGQIASVDGSTLGWNCTANGKATNGAAMKAWVAGLFDAGNIDKAIDDGIIIGKVTHENPVALSGAGAAAAAVSAAMAGADLGGIVDAGLYGAREGLRRSWDMCAQKSAGASVEKRIKLAVATGIKYSNDFNRCISVMADVIGTGLNANEAVPAAFGFAVAAKGDPVKAIYLGVNAGNDTDTIAALSGAICGAHTGAGAFPDDYLELLSSVNGMDIKGLAEKTAEAVS
ncbi:MAG: ADP-ribosylglycohydrolase family protein [Oscillospiraceae bacterium]|jgi:ADP-ribosylglycohydrolase